MHENSSFHFDIKRVRQELWHQSSPVNKYENEELSWKFHSPDNIPVPVHDMMAFLLDILF
jgi:hypothetical protein